MLPFHRRVSTAPDVARTSPANGDALLWVDATKRWTPTALSLTSTRNCGITIGGGGAITTGSKGYTRVPISGTITKATLLANVSGSIVIDVKKCAYSGFPTTSSICASAKPTLSAAQKAEDSTLAGWTLSLSAGDILEFVVDSVSTVTQVTLILEYVG